MSMQWELRKMPIWPNPSISIDAIQNAIDSAIDTTDGSLVSPYTYIFAFPVAAMVPGSSMTDSGIRFKLEQPSSPDTGYMAYPWWVDFSGLDSGAQNGPFGIGFDLNNHGDALFGFFDTTGTSPQNGIYSGISFGGTESGSSVTVYTTNDGTITLQTQSSSGDGSSLILSPGSDITFSGGTSNVDYVFDSIATMSMQEGESSNPGSTWWTITNSNNDVIFSMSATGVVHTNGIDSLNGSYSSTSSYDVRYLNGTSITENWLAAAVSAATSITIDFGKAYSTAGPPFVTFGLSAAGTISGYSVSTTAITIDFSSSYTGDVNVYAMGAS